MKTLKLLLPDQIYQTASELARIEDAEIGQLCLAALSDGLTAIQHRHLDKEQPRPTSTEHASRALPDTIRQVQGVCRLVWQEGRSLNEALRETAYKFGVLGSTVRDKCTRRINLKSITDFSELLSVPKNLIDHLCTKYVNEKTELINLFEAILPAHGSDGDPISISQSPPQREIREMDLINAIIACLKRHGGKLDKREVEREVFELFKESFQHSWYQELVGGGVPRWRKNVQFARNTACNTLGLIKSPGQSGRGIWELTDKGRDWVPEPR